MGGNPPQSLRYPFCLGLKAHSGSEAGSKTSAKFGEVAISVPTAPEDSTPVSEEVSRMVHEAVKNFHECFWRWNVDAPITTRDEVREVIEALRENGGHSAWWTAQAFLKCL